MGYALLDFWGILNAFKQLEDYEARNILPQLLGLYDLPEDEVTGGFVREQGLDAQRLIKAGIIELRGRQSVVLIDEDDDFGEVRLNGPTSNGSISATGLHGEILGKMPVDDVLRFALKRDWLDETILKLVKPSISRPSITSLDDDLIYLGKMKLEHGEVPVHLARRTLALGGAFVVLIKSGPQSATLYIPGKPPLQIHSQPQILIFERLIAAWQNGSPEIKAGHLLESTGSRSPSDAFNAKSRASVIGVYLEKCARSDFWRLSV